VKPLAEYLKSHFGDDFPVGIGSAKRDDPLVITELRLYVPIEYSIARLLLSDYDHELEEQCLHQENGRSIDELVYKAKPIGSKEWTVTRRFFFDITAGFSRLGEL